MNDMEKVSFCTEEVVSYIENMIEMGIATDDESKLYEDYMWSGEIRKFNNTYKRVITNMRNEWENKF